MKIHVSIVFAGALLIRLVLLLVSRWQDANFAVKYTDIDYVVYTDAAREVSQSQSPFERATYRYTPLLAYMMLPNVFVDEICGKVLFITSDLLVGYLLYAMLRMRSLDPISALKYTCIWLFHPFSINISTRGNADTLVALLVLSSLYFLMHQKIILSAILYGLAVHFKIYPIVYALAFLMFLDDNCSKSKISGDENASWGKKIWAWLNWNRIIFSLISGTVFLSLTALFYQIYGFQFLYEAYLYHFTRTDNRHNFSVYFYDLYLRYNTNSGFLMGLLAFLPQLISLFSISIICGKDLFFAVFCLTWCFVIFNKVCTAQYFLWYTSLLPLVLPSSRLSSKSIISMAVVWFAGELHWLYWAYYLEMKGKNTFLQVWVAGLIFFAINIWILVMFISNHDHKSLFVNGKLVPFSKSKTS